VIQLTWNYTCALNRFTAHLPANQNGVFRLTMVNNSKFLRHIIFLSSSLSSYSSTHPAEPQSTFVLFKYESGFQFLLS